MKAHPTDISADLVESALAAIDPCSLPAVPEATRRGVPLAWISRRLGGMQIDYADEAPEVRRMFADALARHGLKPKLDIML